MTIHCHTPNRAAALGYKRIDLFEVSQGMDTHFRTGSYGRVKVTQNDGPRSANKEEVRAYLLDLAAARGIDVPEDATLSQAGIYVEGHGYIVDMPGHGADETVTMITTDEEGTERTSRIGLTVKGALGIDAAAVRKACALPKPARKAPAKRKAAAAPVIATPPPEISPVEHVAPVSAPVAPETAPDALAERVAALEAMVARIARPVSNGKRVRSEAERAAIVRAWRYRAAMRERADLDRRALLATNAAYQGALDVLAIANAESRNARAAAAEYKRTAEALDAIVRIGAARGDRLARIARGKRTAMRRLVADLRGAQAETRAITRRLTEARHTPFVRIATDAPALATVAA